MQRAVRASCAAAHDTVFLCEGLPTADEWFAKAYSQAIYQTLGRSSLMDS